MDSASMLLDEHQHMLDTNGLSLLQNIRSNAANMSQLIDALLNLARITRSEPKVTTVNLSILAKRIINQLSAAEPHRNTDILIDEHLQARMDPALAWTLLDNLITNAWKFAQHSSAAKIELGKQIINNEQVFFIRDNGAGFDESRASELFKPFHRLHSPNGIFRHWRWSGDGSQNH